MASGDIDRLCPRPATLVDKWIINTSRVTGTISLDCIFKIIEERHSIENNDIATGWLRETFAG